MKANPCTTHEEASAHEVTREALEGWIVRKVKEGSTIHWASHLYKVVPTTWGEYLVKCVSNGHCVSLKACLPRREPHQFFECNEGSLLFACPCSG